MLPAEYLTKKGIEFTRRGEELIFNCPFCGDKERKAAMHVETGLFNCMHKNRCGKNGSFWYFQKEMGDKPIAKSYDSDIKKPAKAYIKPEVNLDSLSKEHREWLRGRGLEDDTVDLFGLKSVGAEIAFPYIKNGEIVNVKYRKIDKSFRQEKGAEPVLFNREAFHGNDSIIICEGEIDAISWEQYGRRAASVPSGVSDTRWIENEWDFLEGFTKIYLSLDMDSAGRQAVEQIAQRLGLWRCYDIQLPYKDINECLQNGVEHQAIYRAVEQAEEFRIHEVSTPLEFEDAVADILLNPEHAKGESTPFKTLNDVLGGWRMGELTVWSGTNGSGKTTILNQVILHSMVAHGQSAFLASLEMKPENLLAWMLRQMRSGLMDRRAIHEALQIINRNITLLNKIGKVEPDMIFNVFEFVAKKYGAKHFVLDSLMRVSLGRGDKYERQEEFMNRLVGFAQQYNVHLHLVAHPRKGAHDGETPGKVDVSGSADITNLAHNVLVLYRPAFEPGKPRGDNMLYIKKNRELGHVGALALEFDEDTRLFKESPLVSRA